MAGALISREGRRCEEQTCYRELSRWLDGAGTSKSSPCHRDNRAGTDGGKPEQKRIDELREGECLQIAPESPAAGRPMTQE